MGKGGESQMLSPEYLRKARAFRRDLKQVREETIELMRQAGVPEEEIKELTKAWENEND